MSKYVETVTIGDCTYSFETGRMANQASGSIFVTCGDTAVLVTAVGAKEAKEGIDFLPLTVDYQEKMYAAGKIPGGFFKREGKPRDSETLTSRIIDRSIRPLFPKAWNFETQVIATVLSADNIQATDSISLTAASAALMISDIPFMGPIAGVRVCRIDGTLQINPKNADKEKADIDIFLAVSRDAIVMVEGGAQEASEEDLIEALLFAHEEAKPLLDVQEALMKQAGKEKRILEEKSVDEALQSKVRELALASVEKAYSITAKQDRYEALDQAKQTLMETLLEQDATLEERTGEINAFWDALRSEHVRGKVSKTKSRIDGRGLTDIRTITTEVGILPRVHGSALFTRGETQALVSATLGTKLDEQRIDDLSGDVFKKIMLHYNFPPFSVGEARFLRGPGRREIGHGALAERAITPMIEFSDDFPYAIRLVSEILGSNGSSSMATVCGSSMAMMDAGIPVKKPVAGIAMGLIKEDDTIAILSDILGDEDHLGDMDFKVAGTTDGVTAIQMDIKITGIDKQILTDALMQAKQGRLHILGEMAKTLEKSNTELSEYAPRFTKLQISTDKIKDVIGPGGKIIKGIIAETGCAIDIEDDGTINIASSDAAQVAIAIDIIKNITAVPEVNAYYVGKVQRIVDFGAFIEIIPGTDGLCHISELEDRRVNSVSDILKEGEEVLVKVLEIDPKNGRIRLSRKAALDKNIDDFRK